MKTDQLIEAILFTESDGMDKKDLAKILDIEMNQLESGIKILKEKLSDRGIVLVESENEISLATAIGASEIIEKNRKEELEKDLSKAAIETLAIILYHPNVSKADIDYIRGVNASFILRNLSVRGLVERKTHPNDQRKMIYTPSLELFSYLGITDRENLPEYETLYPQITRALNNEINNE